MRTVKPRFRLASFLTPTLAALRQGALVNARYHLLRPLWSRLRRQLSQLSVGGSWAEQVSQSIRHNLRWFWFDGLFAHASESIVVAYLSLFVLALGANRAQIGLMSALSSLSGAILLLPGAAIVERRGHRKRLVLFGGGGGARVVLLLLALLPLFLSGPAAVSVAIGLAVVRAAFTNLSIPAWTSLTADIVPLTWRGRYFSSRNIGMSIVGMTAALLVGQLINRAGSPVGYQLAMGLAFAIGLVATFCFARLREPDQPTPSDNSRRGGATPPPPAAGARAPGASAEGVTPPTEGRRLHTSRFTLHVSRFTPHVSPFFVFCAVAAVWNLSLGIAGPFFSVYIVETLGASAGFIGLLTTTTTLAALPGQRLFGALTDRWGPHRVQLITGLLIPLVPVGWALTRAPWQVVPVDAVAGFLWAGYGLASFNFLLLLIPEDRRSRYTALYQVAATVALAGGAALGGVLATQWGYRSAFVVSGVGRLLAALLFARLIHTPPEKGM